jgi:DNA repair exonuclease SbcCD ATPase subunit
VTEPESFALIRRDQTQLASSIAAVIDNQSVTNKNVAAIGTRLEEVREEVAELNLRFTTQSEVRKERDAGMGDRLGRIEKSIEDLKKDTQEGFEEARKEMKEFRMLMYSIGKWFIIVVGGSLLAAVMKILLGGAATGLIKGG